MSVKIINTTFHETIEHEIRWNDERKEMISSHFRAFDNHNSVSTKIASAFKHATL